MVSSGNSQHAHHLSVARTTATECFIQQRRQISQNRSAQQTTTDRKLETTIYSRQQVIRLSYNPTSIMTDSSGLPDDVTHSLSSLSFEKSFDENEREHDYAEIGPTTSGMWRGELKRESCISFKREGQGQFQGQGQSKGQGQGQAQGCINLHSEANQSYEELPLSQSETDANDENSNIEMTSGACSEFTKENSPIEKSLELFTAEKVPFSQSKRDTLDKKPKSCEVEIGSLSTRATCKEFAKFQVGSGDEMTAGEDCNSFNCFLNLFSTNLTFKSISSCHFHIYMFGCQQPSVSCIEFNHHISM